MSLLRDPEGNEPSALGAHLDWTGKRVLEIGCGNGRLTRRYAGWVPAVFAFDVDAESLLEARRTLAGDLLASRVHLHLAEAERLPYPRQSFDLALFAWSF